LRCRHLAIYLLPRRWYPNPTPFLLPILALYSASPLALSPDGRAVSFLLPYFPRPMQSTLRFSRSSMRALRSRPREDDELPYFSGSFDYDVLVSLFPVPSAPSDSPSLFFSREIPRSLSAFPSSIGATRLFVFLKIADAKSLPGPGPNYRTSLDSFSFLFTIFTYGEPFLVPSISFFLSAGPAFRTPSVPEAVETRLLSASDARRKVAQIIEAISFFLL